MGVMDSFEQLQAAKAECVRLERELAAALAVIEKARQAIPVASTDLWWAREVDSILASVDTSALAEYRRQVIEEAIDLLADEQQQAPFTAAVDTGFTAALNRLRALTENGADA